LMFITSFGEQNITYKCCSNFLIHLFTNKYTCEEQVHLHMRITAYGLTKIAELVNNFFSEDGVE